MPDLEYHNIKFTDSFEGQFERFNKLTQKMGVPEPGACHLFDFFYNQISDSS